MFCLLKTMPTGWLVCSMMAPADAGLVRVAGPDHVEPGDIPKRGELLDRLMGRPSSLSPIESRVQT